MDDPYVSERLYALAYGVSLVTSDDRAVGSLAETVFDLVFREGKPLAHVLLRDYARGVVGAAAHRNVLPPGMDIEATRPAVRIRIHP